MRADAGPAVRTGRPSRQDRASRQGRRGATRHRVLVALGTAAAAAAATAYLTALATHPMAAMLKGFDLRVYLGGARQALSDPGRLYAWTYAGHPGIQFTYTPFAALVLAAGLALPFNALIGLVTGISVLALGVTVGIAFRELGWRGAPRLGATLLVAGLALWTEPVQRALVLGQVEIVLMALVTWDLCQPDGRRLKGAATGLAAGIKLVPLLFIVYLLLTRRFRQGAVATAAFAVTVAAGFTAFPSASAAWWLGGDFVAAGRAGFVGSQQNQSLRGALTRLAGSVNGAHGLRAHRAARLADQLGSSLGLGGTRPRAPHRHRSPRRSWRPRLVRARRGDLGDLRRLARLLVRQGRPAPGRPYRLRSRLRLGVRRQPGLRRVPLARPAPARGQPGTPRRPHPVRRRAGGRLPLAQDHLLAARPAEGNGVLSPR